MASTEVLAPAPEEPEKTVPPAPEPEEKTVPPPEAPVEAPPPETKAAEPAPPPNYLVVADVVLRVVLFAAALTSVVVMVTSDQTKLFPPFSVARPAKFNHSPAFIYFVVALSVACLYSIITAAVSFLALLKPDCTSKLLAHFLIFDVLIFGIVAAATGAAGAVAYIGLNGNSHVGWGKVCDIYDKFCQQVGASVFVSLVASVVLVLLVILSAYSLSKKIPQ